MGRFDLGRLFGSHILQVILFVVLLAFITTASIGGVEAKGRLPESATAPDRITELAPNAQEAEPTPSDEVLPTPFDSPTIEPTPAEPLQDPTVELPPTEEPTVEPTAEPTVPQDPTAEPTLEPTLEPTVNPQPTEIPTDVPTSEPTATEEPTSEPTAGPTLTDEPTVEPTVTETPGVTESPSPTAPADLTETVVPTETTEPTFTPTAIATETGTPLPTLSATPAITLSIQPRCDRMEKEVDLQAGGKLVIPNCDPSKQSPQLEVIFPAGNQLVSSAKGPVPASAQNEKRSVRFRNGGENNGTQHVTGIFSLNLFDAEDKKIADPKFSQPVTLIAHYDPEALTGLNESILDLAYWDEDIQAWIPLYGNIDFKNHTITAQTDHFTQFSLTALDVKSYIPQVQGFETDLFSGSATASYPIVVPPGQSGLAPNLNLAYSSGSVEGFSSHSQASYVGVGWALDTGYIVRDVAHRNISSAPNGISYFSLVLDGVGYDLVQDGSGKFHTNSETYWDITAGNVENGVPDNLNPKTWTIKTKDGATYVFGQDDSYVGWWYRRNGESGPFHPNREYYIWVLKSVTDAHSNKIEYAYAKESTTCSINGQAYTLALKPTSISYNKYNTQYLSKVDFVYSNRNDKPVNYPTTQCGRAPYMAQKLDRIDVKTALSTGNLTPQTVRQYHFGYTTVFNGIPYTETLTSGALALDHFWRQDPADANNQLHEGIFSYHPNNRLKDIKNGLGAEGRVTFNYDAWNQIPGSTEHSRIYTENFNCPGGGTACQWTPSGLADFGISQQCPSDGGPFAPPALKVWPSGAEGYASFRYHPFAPGGYYYVNARVEGDGEGGQAWIAISANGSSLAATGNPKTNFSSCTPVDLSTLGFRLPDGANRLEVRVYTTGNLRVRSVVIDKLAVAPYVVTSRQVLNGLGQTYTYGYDYGAANNLAVNDENTSAVIVSKNCAPPSPVDACAYLRYQYGTQFRGFKNVVVTDPAGNKATHLFYQDDVYKGKEYEVTERNSGTTIFLKTSTTFAANQTVAPSNDYGEQSNFTFVRGRLVETYDPLSQGNIRKQYTSFDHSAACGSYGNLCAVVEHGDKGTNPSSPYYRKTTYTYVNLSNNIRNKVEETKVYSGTDTALISYTKNWYSNPETAGCSTSKGDVWKVDVREDATTTRSTKFICNVYGAYTHIGNARGYTTTTTYDALYGIFPATVKDPLNHTTTTTYNYKFGLPETVTDPNNAATKYEYDAFGRKSKVFNPRDNVAGNTNASTIISYNLYNTAVPNIKVDTRTDDGGTATPTSYHQQWTFFDGLGRVIQEQTRADFGGSTQPIVVDTTYNTTGQVSFKTNPYAGTTPGVYMTPNPNNPRTAYLYDALGRETFRTTPDSKIITTTYSVASNLLTTRVANENNDPTQSQVDSLDRIIYVTEYIGGTPHLTTYGYDALDRLSTVLDRAGYTTTMTYDWLGRKLTMDDPDMGNWVYKYDEVGNLKRQTDARGYSLCFDYDALNRPTQKRARTINNCNQDASAYTVTYTYDQTANGNDGKGRRTRMDDPSGFTEWKYNALGLVGQESKTINGTNKLTKWKYGSAGQVTEVIYPDNEQVCTKYNKQFQPNRLISACDTAPANYVSTTIYNPANQVTDLTYGNGITSTFGYNAQTLRLLNFKTGPTNNIQNHVYGYDNVGNVTSILDRVPNPDQTSNFTYDDLDRLTHVDITGVYSQDWQYTPIGNINWRKDDGVQSNYTFDTNRPHAVINITVGGTTKHYCYDANGNMTKRGASNSTCTTGGDTLTWDVENRLTSIAVGGTTTTYLYDGDGNRVQKTVGGTTTRYWGNLYEEGPQVVKYYYMGARRIAMKQGTTLSYIHSDHLGSTSVTTNASAACTSAQWYKPYGDNRTPAPTLPCSGASPTDFGFTGQRKDASAGLMYYGARYYDTGLGRFVSADTLVPSPVDPQNLNRYAYTLNNPLRYTDPSGYCVDTEQDQTVEVCDAPPTVGGRIDLMNKFRMLMGMDLDWLNAEFAFASWIYNSGRMESKWWNISDGYLIMSRFAALTAVNNPGLSRSSLEPGVAEWINFIGDPTQQRFWQAHNTALREGVRRVDAEGLRSEESLAEQEHIETTLYNVYNVGDRCAVGDGYACLVSSSSILDLGTQFYPTNYPSSVSAAAWAPRYDSSLPGVIGMGVNWSALQVFYQISGCSRTVCAPVGDSPPPYISK